MSARFLDDEARAAFQRAIETVENASAAEVVVAVRRRSGSYLHANLIVGAIVAFAGLAAMLFSAHEFGLIAILVDPFVVGLIAGAAVEILPDVKRGLSSTALRRHHVERAARAAFVERGVDHTTGRSGVLVYISWLERAIVLVADRGLRGALGDDALRAAETKLTTAMRRGGAAVAAELAGLADACAAAMPHRADDVNELPDAIDSDLDRAERSPR